MYAYWHENVETHALMIVSSARSTSRFLDGDSSIAGSSGDHIATQQAPYVDIGIPAQAPFIAKTPRQPSTTPNPRPKKKKAKSPAVHNVVNGLHTTNRRGFALCAGFQTGNCSGCDKKHQCNKCLSMHHGSAQCTQPTAQPPRGPRGKGKGKGKGKQP